eukprot:TRINITY_DN7931_c0_g1_i2.p2 TRINITY_DN7931_c0_g1~~TRINITY_DN7931_c0_g1_i2.p2  ORF type:complete len:111 (-),score=12.41 TRINITY_DN7931_c0_g1_i2:77-409(-)
MQASRLPPTNVAATCRWRPTEVSLARESFNALVCRTKPDVPEVLVQSANLSRRVMTALPAIGTGNPRSSGFETFESSRGFAIDKGAWPSSSPRTLERSTIPARKPAIAPN